MKPLCISSLVNIQDAQAVTRIKGQANLIWIMKITLLSPGLKLDEFPGPAVTGDYRGLVPRLLTQQSFILYSCIAVMGSGLQVILGLTLFNEDIIFCIIVV